MIANEKEYEITKTQLEKFKKAIKDFDFKEKSHLMRSEIIAKAQLDALKSEYEILTEQIAEYKSK